jgi:hypothetical protein
VPFCVWSSLNMPVDTIKIQINYTRDYQGITYSDSLYFDQDEYASLTPEDIQAAEDDRYNAWVSAITTPAPTPAPAPQTVFTKFGFRGLFTLSELIAIDNYDTNSTLPADAKAAIKSFLFSFSVADEIDTTDPTTQQGVQFLEQCGLIAAGRAAQILGA